MVDHQADLTGATVTFGSTVALDRVDFHVHSGELVVLLGANGSGKTTLVRALLGLVPLAAGSVSLFGEAADRFRDHGRIGYVPQRSTAAAGVPASVMEVVLTGRLARTPLIGGYRKTDRDAALKALDVVDMAGQADRPIATLSGGQQQRVLIARALAGEPDLLVLDEPVSGVDLEHQESFAGTLGSLIEQGRSVLLVAHALGVVEPLVTRAVVLTAGRVSYNGPVVEHLHDSHMHHHPHSKEEERIRYPAGGRG